MTNKLYLVLETISKENELRAKAKKEKEKELINIAWKMLKRNYMSVFEYMRIVDKNHGKAF